jgi:hypothetical protein
MTDIVCFVKNVYLFWKCFISIYNVHEVMLLKLEPTSKFPEGKVLAVEFDHMADFSSW